MSSSRGSYRANELSIRRELVSYRFHWRSANGTARARSGERDAGLSLVCAPGALLRVASRLVLALLVSPIILTLPGDAEEVIRVVPGDDGTLEQSWKRKVYPFLQVYCIDCHDADSREGELDLSGFDSLSSLEEGSSSLQRVLEMVSFGAMPPHDVGQPSQGERQAFVELVDRTLFSVTCDLRPRPGKVTARRLNRSEYTYSIRDLFGTNFNVAEGFPSDEVGAGFDNNGDVLSLSPLLMEKYLDAAELIASEVVIDPASLPKLDREFASDQLLISGETQVGRFNGRFFKQDAYCWIDFETPFEGRYRMSYSGGNSTRDSVNSRIGVFGEKGRLLAFGEVKYYGGGGSSNTFHFDLELGKGQHRLFFQAIDANREPQLGVTEFPSISSFNESVVQSAKAVLSDPLKPDQRIQSDLFPHMVRTIRVSGPQVIPKDALPPSHRSIVKRDARFQDGHWRDVEISASESLGPLLRRAFRRPVHQDELDRYVSLVAARTELGDTYYQGLQAAVAAILVSPKFLFRVESPSEHCVVNQDGSVSLTAFQIATRLSYFLWSSLPDEELLRVAEEGGFDQRRFEKQLDRMLRDPKSDALAEQFAAQWLGLRNLETHEADTERFESFSDSLRKSMATETKMLFLHILRENLPITELLTADYSFLNAELAKHYKIDGVKGERFVRVSLGQSGRRGILTHGSVLTLTSYPRRTSPVLRGKWILENVLGTPPPEPPSNVPSLDESQSVSATASLRKQMEAHRSDPVCSSCHRVMDQLGFGLEEFDAVGIKRQMENTSNAFNDATGELPGGRRFTGAEELTILLGETEARAFAKTTVHRMLTFALGRELSPEDRCIVDDIVRNTEASGYRLRDLISEVVQCRTFLNYQWNEVEVSKMSKPK